MVEGHDAPGTTEELERIAHQAAGSGEAWERTVRDMRVTAHQREKEGYKTQTIPAGHTAPVAPGSGSSERFGFSHVIPDGDVTRFQELFDAGSYSETDVYQAGVQGNVFIVTECRDPDARLAIFIGGNYQRRHAPALVKAATKRGEMYTHVKKIDGTHLGTFEHDDPSSFFPDPQEFGV